MEDATYVVEPYNFVDLWIGFDFALEINVIALCKIIWVQIGAKGQYYHRFVYGFEKNKINVIMYVSKCNELEIFLTVKSLVGKE